MRRQLAGVFLLLSVLLVLAFLIPLGFLILRTAEDRALDSARSDVSALVPALAASEDAAVIDSAISVTDSGQDGLMTVILPDQMIIGREIGAESQMLEALADRRSIADRVNDSSGDIEVVRIVGVLGGEVAAVRVLVPNGELRRGVSTAWLTLGVVGVALTAMGVFAADRLARGVVRSTEHLADVAQQLGEGDLTARVEPDGPPELQKLGDVFNDLGSQVEGMLERERALVADMSHRLRTPLTRLRLRIDQVPDPVVASELRDDLDETTSALTSMIGEARSAIDRRAERASCDVAATMRERSEFWRVLADEQNRPMLVTLPDTAIMGAISRQAVVEMIDIFLDNVFSYTEVATGFSMGADVHQGHVRMWVADGGPGFGAGIASKSSGRGLNIARQRLAAVGGHLVQTESPHGGAMVLVQLPLAKVSV